MSKYLRFFLFLLKLKVHLALPQKIGAKNSKRRQESEIAYVVPEALSNIARK